MKKVFGFLLIIIGSILSLGNLINTLKSVIEFTGGLTNLDAYSIGYLLGTTLFFIMIMALAIFLIIKGAKLAKSDRQKIKEPVDSY